jgi:hypothetical protein
MAVPPAGVLAKGVLAKSERLLTNYWRGITAPDKLAPVKAVL